ncbi:hypothetical protein [Entomomonas asaccharolytica]|uniref:Lipoprotein n=1 Tax=Entomomonas asaccharolytica TaxID=2785331 RepID=A0A974NCZ4_9GAMM|nr:hypothetical protein [Entomomonas asaccharolytica]QQP84476.1 hypothetical protein JHT90_08570 [Entomomonas asaccharolytica]
MLRLFITFSLLVLTGCITVYECEGEHKETYNNISPTTQQSTTTNRADQTLENGGQDEPSINPI